MTRSDRQLPLQISPLVLSLLYENDLLVSFM
jgi:hypothetical protein